MDGNVGVCGANADVLRIGGVMNLWARNPRCVAAIVVILVSALAVPLKARAATRDRVVFVTLAEGLQQARRVEVLIDSIRSFGGLYSQAPVYVVADRVAGATLAGRQRPGVTVLGLELPAVAEGFPLAAKVYAAARVEGLVEERARTLIWMDSGTLVLGSVPALDLGRRAVVALRPVSLVNRVGIAPDQPVDGYWSAIYDLTGVDAAEVPVVESVVDGKRLRFYVNCEIIAYRADRGICREWSRAFTAALGDKAFLAQHCGDPLRRLFLHQAVLSAVILARTEANERRWLPRDHGYSLLLHDRLPAERRVARLNDLACAIYDLLWDQNPNWLAGFVVDEPLRSWLERAYHSTFRVTDRLYRSESQRSAYLLRTAAGDVVIDPGGASEPSTRCVRSMAARRFSPSF
jgi:hypothetical protein